MASVKKQALNTSVLRSTRVDEILAHGTVNPEEAADLFKVLQNFAAGDFELGEALKSTSLPLDAPPPTINFQGARFCFTGTFTFGTRRECEAAATGLGGRRRKQFR
jgi:hypothetical protein